MRRVDLKDDDALVIAFKREQPQAEHVVVVTLSDFPTQLAVLNAKLNDLDVKVLDVCAEPVNIKERSVFTV